MPSQEEQIPGKEHIIAECTNVNDIVDLHNATQAEWKEWAKNGIKRIEKMEARLNDLSRRACASSDILAMSDEIAELRKYLEERRLINHYTAKEREMFEKMTEKEKDALKERLDRVQKSREDMDIELEKRVSRIEESQASTLTQNKLIMAFITTLLIGFIIFFIEFQYKTYILRM